MKLNKKNQKTLIIILIILAAATLYFVTRGFGRGVATNDTWTGTQSVQYYCNLNPSWDVCQRTVTVNGVLFTHWAVESAGSCSLSPWTYKCHCSQVTSTNSATCGGGNTGTCTDSDGGDNSYVKGTVTDANGGTHTDKCVTNPNGASLDPWLTEYNCQSGSLYVSGSGPCPFSDTYKCVDGACVAQTVTCEPGSMRCNGNDLEFCTGSGDEWVSQGTNTCTDTGARCIPGTTELCADTIIADNYYYCKVPTTSCGTAGCSNNACANPIICVANTEKQCVSPTQYRQCNSAGTAWLSDVTCPASTPSCTGAGICSVTTTCTETDSGDNPYVKGTVTDRNGGTHTDKCVTNPNGASLDPWLTEYYCQEGSLYMTGSSSCPNPDTYKCVDGACIEPTCTSYVCKDIGNKWCVDSNGKGITSTITPCAAGTEKCEAGACISTTAPTINPVTELTIKDITAAYTAADNKITAKATFTSTKTGETIVEGGSNINPPAQAVTPYSSVIDANTCNPTESWVANRKISLTAGTDTQVTFTMTPKDGAGLYTVYALACDKCANAGSPTCHSAVTTSVTVTGTTICDYDGTCDTAETNVGCPDDCPTIICDNDKVCDTGENALSCNDCGEQKKDYCYYAGQLNFFNMDDPCIGGSLVGAGILILGYILINRFGQPQRRRYR